MQSTAGTVQGTASPRAGSRCENRDSDCLFPRNARRCLENLGYIRRSHMKNVASLALASLLASCAVAFGQASQADTYPTMAPIAKYLMPSAAAEIAMARTAAPASVSADAEILVLTTSGYVVAANGKN